MRISSRFDLKQIDVCLSISEYVNPFICEVLVSFFIVAIHYAVNHLLGGYRQIILNNGVLGFESM